MVTDLRMPPPDGLALLKEIKASWPAVDVILMTAHGDEDTAVQAMRAGAYDYLKKDPKVDPDEIQLRIERLLETRQAARERERLAREVTALRTGAVPIVGESPALQEALGLARKVAPTDATVLVRGESGTGKDLFARAIHFGSSRAGGPWVKVNCGALTKSHGRSWKDPGTRIELMCGSGPSGKKILNCTAPRVGSPATCHAPRRESMYFI